MKVPDILISGNHEQIKSWRREKSFERTLKRRSDLISNENYKKSPQSKSLIKEYNQFMKFKIGIEHNNYPDW
jgi:2-C-methyl-D-erythritol 2,4-cyclodiphosphate synthase